MVVTGADERIHAVEDASEHWSDSLYFNVWDEANGLFLLTRMAVLPNRPGATAGVLAWQHGTPFWGYGHDLDEVPLADWDDMRIGALRYRELVPLESWEVTLGSAAASARGDGPDAGGGPASPAGGVPPDAAMRLRWDGFTGVVDYADNRDRLPRAVAWGHYEQTCRVTGDLSLGGRNLSVDGVGQRDHSWGFRHWAGLAEWHWVTGFLGPVGGARTGPVARSFNLFHVVQPDGTTTVNGFVHDGGADHLVVAATRELHEGPGRTPERFEVVLEVDGGRRFTISGEGDGAEVPVRPAPAQDTVVHERLMRLSTDDGLAGAGIYEFLVNG